MWREFAEWKETMSQSEKAAYFNSESVGCKIKYKSWLFFFNSC